MKEINNNTGYLTEEILYKILLQNKIGNKIVNGFPKKGRDDKLAEKYNITYFRKKYDIAVEKDDILYLIEFDGILHYTSPKQYNKDIKFTINTDKVQTIRIPFFVQLNNITYNFIFPAFSAKNINYTVDSIDYSKYPHGFVSDISISQGTPAFFCGLGAYRFLKEMKSLPLSVSKDINKSLYNIVNNGTLHNEVFLHKLDTI